MGLPADSGHQLLEGTAVTPAEQFQNNGGLAVRRLPAAQADGSLFSGGRSAWRPSSACYPRGGAQPWEDVWFVWQSCWRGEPWCSPHSATRI